MGLIGGGSMDGNWDVIEWIGSGSDAEHGEGTKLERRYEPTQ